MREDQAREDHVFMSLCRERKKDTLKRLHQNSRMTRHAAARPGRTREIPYPLFLLHYPFKKSEVGKKRRGSRNRYDTV